MPSLLLTTSIPMGIHDSDTGVSIRPIQVWNMSDMSPLGQSWLLLYGQAQRGMIVKIVLFSGDVYRPHYTAEAHWNSLLKEKAESGDTLFSRFAEDIGFTKEGLMAVVRKHAPNL